MAAKSALASSLLLLALGCDQLERLRAKVAPVRASSPSPTASGEAPVQTQANAELLAEIHQVVFGWPPRNQQTFSSLVDSLNQGASLEGMYNGFVNSMGYHELEESQQGVSQAALDLFNEQVGVFGVNMKEESKMASIFSLKRLLGDAALQWIGAKKANRDELASWYADWAAAMASKKVDFGVSLRNKPDREFHLKWAKQASDDRITWEVLNRVHRMLNEAQKKS